MKVLADLNFYSALSGLIGTVLIFFFGLPPKVDQEGNSYLLLEQGDEKELKKAKKYKFLSYLGLSLLGISFAFQLINIFSSASKNPVISNSVSVSSTVSTFTQTKQDLEIPEYIKKIFPTSTIKNIDNIQFEINSKTYYIQNIDIASTTFYVAAYDVYYSGENIKEGTVYRFYSTGSQPELIKEIASLVPSEDAIEAFGKITAIADITGDGVPEISVLVLTPGAAPDQYEVLNTMDKLKNIVIQGRKDNPSWVEYNDIFVDNGRVYLGWHGTYERGWTEYLVRKNILIFSKSVGCSWKDYSATQGDITVEKPQKIFKIIDRVELDDSRCFRDALRLLVPERANSYNF
jgi:hypothetical protein